MVKNILQDIKPLTKKTITSEIQKKENRSPDSFSSNESGGGSDNYSQKPKKIRKVFFISIFILAVAGVYVLGTYVFNEASVTLDRRVETTELNETIVASRQGDGDISFEVMSFESTASKLITSSKTETVSTKARGKVILYNAFNQSTQKLVKGTRLEAKNGKIYRLTDTITIPGQTGSGTNAIPGQIEVTVEADEAGDAYNQETADLSIVGFKGSSKYEKFYGRTVSSISGGSTGLRHVLGSNEELSAKNELETLIRAKILREAKAQVPEDYVLFEGSYNILEKSVPGPFSSTTENIEVLTEGVFQAFIFKREELEAYITKKTLSQYDGAPVKISNLESLVFKTQTAYDEISSVKELSFSLSGNPIIRFVIDTDEMKQKLLELNEDRFNEVMVSFKGVKSALLRLRPFWIKTLPDTPTRIHININEE